MATFDTMIFLYCIGGAAVGALFVGIGVITAEHCAKGRVTKDSAVAGDAII